MLDSLAASLATTLEASWWPGLADRAVLVLNHLLRAQAGASQRLLVHAGKTVRIDWRAAASGWPTPPSLRLRVTPAGLFEREPSGATDTADATSVADGLRIEIDLPAPLELARAMVEGRRPGTRVEGDTQFAADLAWLAEHLRWDAEDDLSRVLGDRPARTLVTAGQAVRAALRSAAERWTPRAAGGASGTGGAASR